jgi:hypothetical protein
MPLAPVYTYSGTVKTTDRVDTERNRGVDDPGHHHPSGHEIRKVAAKRMARMGWLAVAAMTMLTFVSVAFLRSTLRGPSGRYIPGYDRALRDFRDQIMQIDVNDEEAVKQGMEQIVRNRPLWHNTEIENDILSKVSEINGLQRSRPAPREAPK